LGIVNEGRISNRNVGHFDFPTLQDLRPGKVTIHKDIWEHPLVSGIERAFATDGLDLPSVLFSNSIHQFDEFDRFTTLISSHNSWHFEITSL
jgi:hypothetical protein